MDIRIEPHTLERAKERGTNEKGIRDVITNGVEVPAKYGRAGKAKVYEYQQTRLGKYYPQKRVEVIYVKENDTIITITVYVFYGEW